ncbi:cation transporter [Candidatus Gottesmanbacteria bacterium]|nr:cation transporter [Candidatus Gottesmanbacteria bacterium]
MIKKTYKVKGIHCSSCPLVIEGELEDIGVKARCNYASERLEVEYDDATLDETKILAAVKSAGYDLTN